MSLQFELVDSGVDWITATGNRSGPIRALTTRAHLWAMQEEKRGMEMRPWSMSGYRGIGCGSVQFGEREDGFIFRLGAHLAKRNWRHVFDVTRRASRIDLQYTLRFNCDPSQVITRHYRQAKREKKRCPGGPSYQLVQASDTSSTLYLGSRVSDVFVRIYDKQRQSKMDHYSRCVRFEAEYKNVRAMSVAHELLSSDDEGGTVQAIVAGLLQNRRQSPWLTEWNRASFDAPLPSSDASRKLRWLAVQVAPVCKSLIDAGYIDEVMSALSVFGLANKVQQGPEVDHSNMIH